jgi:hypothetical protein
VKIRRWLLTYVSGLKWFGTLVALRQARGTSHMFSGTLRLVARSFSLLLLSTFATANTCNSFANYTCARSTPNTVHILGQRPTCLSVGTTGGLITENSFGVQMAGNVSASEIIIIAAFAGSLGGTLNGQKSSHSYVRQKLVPFSCGKTSAP